MAFKFLGQRQLGKLPSRWVSTILMVAIITGVCFRSLSVLTLVAPVSRGQRGPKISWAPAASLFTGQKTVPCTENKPYTAPSDKYRIHTHIIPQVLAFAGATEYNMYCQVRHSRCVWRNPSVYRGCGGSNTTSLLALFCPASIIYGFRPKSNTYFGFPGHFRAKQPPNRMAEAPTLRRGGLRLFCPQGPAPPAFADQWNISFFTRITAAPTQSAAERVAGNHQKRSRGRPPAMFMP